ncbi:methyl-accepting chemotaxis protein [Phytobacter sp. RSE-02]|uniref:methyl-accepting chemotaxis protein n=1 Tax=Phytobacter sp. RSE-02 TaxID=3229229 RepID=UPI00339D6F3C
MQLLTNLKIKMVMVSILIVFTLIWGGVSFFSLHSLNSLKKEIDLTNVQQANGDIINNASDRYYQVKLAMDQIIEYQASGDMQHSQQIMDQVRKDIDFLQNGLDTFKVTNHANINSTTIDNIYNSSLMLFTLGIKPMFEAVQQNNGNSYNQLRNGKYTELRNGFTQAIVSYNQEIQRLKSEANNRIVTWVSLSKTIIIIAMVLGLAVLLLTERYLSIFMGRSLEWVKNHLHILSEGRLDKPAQDLGKNEVGELIPFLNTMQSNWVKTVSEIRSTAGEIYQGSSEIAAGNTDLSSRTEEQAAALTETAASMEELSAMVKQNADNASDASVLAQAASSAVNQGEEVVQLVINSMKNITGSSQKITEIINVIDSIAFQTNILALNAAVEAARAGEQGRGFAVVASEVRNLAQRSANAAKEIKTLIDESVTSVNEGYQQVSLTSESMDNIQKSVRSVTEIMSEIASASVEQSKGIIQVGTAISQMDSVTQQNAALVEQSSATSSSLEEQAYRLTEVVSVFKLPGDTHYDAVRRSPVGNMKQADQLPTQKADTKSRSSDAGWASF